MSSIVTLVQRIALPTGLALISLSAHGAFAQNPILVNSAYYYTGASTISTDLGNNDVVIGRSPGVPPGPNTDINLGTTDQTAYAVTVVDGAKINYSSNNSYTGLNLYNRNILNVQGGAFGITGGITSFDNSTVNLSGGQGLGFGYDYFRMNALGNSTINFNGAVYCDRIDSGGTATLNINGVNSNGVRLQNVIGRASSTININANADIVAVESDETASLNFNAGKSSNVIIASTGANRILGGTISSIQTYNSGIVDVLGGVTSALITGFTGSGTSSSSTANVRGGTINGIFNGDFSTVNIFGGTVGDVQTFENSVTNIYGGTIGSNTLYAKDSGVVNVFGFGFSLSGIVGTGTDSNGAYNIYNLTGTLQDGTALSTKFRDYAGGNQIGGANSPLVFNAPVVVPEANSLFLALIVFAAFGAGMVRRREATQSAA